MTASTGVVESNAGFSTCPICQITWLVTKSRDCLMPVCGCYGFDQTEANADRPCEPCGVIHALACPKKLDPERGIR